MRTGIRIASLWQRALSLVSVAAVAACGDTTGPPSIDLGKDEGEGVVGEWVHSGFYDRTYTLHLPPKATGPGLMPLLIMLHGAGDTGASFRSRIGGDAATDEAGFITVYPDGISGTWSVGCGCTSAELAGANDVIFLNTLIRQLAAELPVDTSRVFLAGYSQGGQLAQRYACTSGSPPAGVASVAASLYRGVAERCEPAAPFSVILIHGDADQVMRYDGFGGAANVLSAEETRDAWVGAMGCAAEPSEEVLPDDNADGTEVRVSRFSGCLAGSLVEFDRVRGGGHTWPGNTGPWPKSTGKLSRNMDATARILALFAAGGPA
ncbi:MAG TPA: PHB depolymerase family esterase [Longimicrobiales bacterium]|nr:PHB depolymerase family esterase [Longimicrobiales bacterium]